MFDLLAITGRAAEVSGPSRRQFYAECRRPNMYMSVEADQPVDSFFFDNAELTLVCRADLLVSEKSFNVAAHLANLYEQKGDGFVRDLRGTFAILLYDHRQRTLKAWIDHFGAERLVFSETNGSLVVSTSIEILVKAQRRQPAISAEAIREYLLYTWIPNPK